MIYLRLFYEFFKTGLFSVGGGLATLPFLQEMSARTGWFTSSELADMLAVSESTPGAIGINMATYVGWKTAGVPGGVIATLGLIAPSIVVILVIAYFLQSFHDNKYVTAAFYGIRPASTALIAAAGVSVLLIALVNTEQFALTGSLGDLISLKGAALFVILWLLTNVVKPTTRLHPIVFIAFSAAVGIVFSFAGA
ncbi:MAG: chromate transporter [Oscillospiraceae bacterium]|nr:chromate transporter [Oscillospiraceae bacterium]